jgi:hypothetical protein
MVSTISVLSGICRIFYGRREGITISRCYFTDITGILEKVCNL